MSDSLRHKSQKDREVLQMKQNNEEHTSTASVLCKAARQNFMRLSFAEQSIKESKLKMLFTEDTQSSKKSSDSAEQPDHTSLSGLVF